MVEKESRPQGFLGGIRNRFRALRRRRKKKSGVIPGNCQHLGARSDQQDAFGFSNLEDEELVKNSGALAVVADGMGGLKLGREASNFAVKAFLDLYTSEASASETIPTRLAYIVHEVNNRLNSMALEINMEMNMGTTLLAAVIKNSELFYLSVGDSRLYHYKDNKLSKLTMDHVYARELEKRAANGELTISEVQNHPDRHALTSYLGIPEIREIDQNTEPVALTSGDRILLLTDGVYNNITEEELMSVMKLPPQEAAEEIINAIAAKEYVNQDNMTAVILEYNQ